jgi:hypothetical protein
MVYTRDIEMCSIYLVYAMDWIYLVYTMHIPGISTKYILTIYHVYTRYSIMQIYHVYTIYLVYTRYINNCFKPDFPAGPGSWSQSMSTRVPLDALRAFVQA